MPELLASRTKLYGGGPIFSRPERPNRPEEDFFYQFIIYFFYVYRENSFIIEPVD